MAQPKKKEQPKEKNQNKKAFTYSGGRISHKKKMQRLGDLQAKRDRKTVIDKTPANEGPPYVVVVQGPPGVGKTTLIRSLVKHYSKTTLGDVIEGPVTLVSGRIRRLTFIECPANDMRAMLDLGKVADLVLLMVDGSRSGFEMETFEFINILQVHGFPRVMGVLTHLDGFKETKTLRKTKKTFKQRFWTELYDGAKMFNLSGLQYGNRYNKTEVMNLARFISVQRFPPLSWRQSHPYLLGLRCEVGDDQTEGEKMAVSVYGYVCGSRMRQGQLAHLPGLGDFTVDKIQSVIDPCPLPQHLAAQEKAGNGLSVRDFSKSTGAPLRTLADKHKSIYAPYCNAENVAVEKDAMYITLRNHTSHFTALEEINDEENDSSSNDDGGEAVKMVRQLQKLSVNDSHDEQDEEDFGGLQLVKGGIHVMEQDQDISTDEESCLDVEDDIDGKTSKELDDEETDLTSAVYASGSQRKQKHGVRKAQLFADSDSEDSNYGPDNEEENIDEEEGRIFVNLKDSEIDSLTEKLRRTKVFSSFTLSAAANKDQSDDQSDDQLDDQEGSEDIEEERERNAISKQQARASALENDQGEEYRHRLEGTGGVVSSVARMEEDGAFEIGQFVKISFFNVSKDFLKPLSTPARPLIIGGIPLGAESRTSSNSEHLIQIKRHRWNPKILKNLDPVVVSAGWRRFQAQPLYAMEDRDGKHRMLKYTPEHMHCFCLVSAPPIPPATGVMFIKDWRAIPNYRVSATGAVVEHAEKIKVLKKIKLVGEPFKVHDKTAFIKGMFNSDLEVEKCLHAKIQTVSGIVGEIKKAHKDNGDFRATFGHKIQMSDLVVMKAWVPVPAPSFCNPMIDLDIWPRMRSINEIRRDTGTPIPHKPDSSYGNAKQDRSKISNKFAKIRIPTKLMEALPYKSKQKVHSAKPKSIKSAEKNDIERSSGAITLPGSSNESQTEMRKLRSIIHGLNVVRKSRIESRRDKAKEKKDLREKREKFIQDKRDAHKDESKKRKYAIDGARAKSQRKRMRLDRNADD